jgi:hypothetical protein
MKRTHRKSISTGMRNAWAGKSRAERAAWAKAISKGHRRRKRR